MPGIALSVSEAMERAIAEYERGNFKVASAICSKIVEIHDDHFDAWYLLGVARADLGI